MLITGPFTQSAPIIGIVDKLQSPAIGSAAGAPASSRGGILLPSFPLGQSYIYIVRVQKGSLPAVMKRARTALLDIDRLRVIGRMQSISEYRRETYRSNGGLAMMLSGICVLLLLMSALGILGVTSCWVVQSRSQIGIHRAMGATRAAVLRLFHGENALIVTGGALVGVLLGVAGNLWLVSHLAMTRVPIPFFVYGGITIVLLAQVVVFWPALQAACVPPAEAVRRM